MARTVPRMDDLESEAWLALVTVAELLPAALDAQLQRDAGMTHFEFMVLSALQLAPEHTVQLKQLAASTNATLPRLSHVVSRLEKRGLVERAPCPGDGRATNAHLTDAGRRAFLHALPGHLATVRRLVLEPLDRAQLAALADVAGTVAGRLDPAHRFGVTAPSAADPGAS